MNKRILRRPTVLEMCGLSNTSLERLEQQGRFPQRINITERSVGWSESAVNEWVQERLDGKPA